MDNCIKKKTVIELTTLLKKAENYVDTAPEGTLKCQERRGKNRAEGKVYYYRQFKDEKTGKFKKEYITKDKEKLARKLAQKAYFLKVIPLLRVGIEKGDKAIIEAQVNSLYDNLPDGRKMLVTPIWLSVEELLRRWNNESYEPYQKYKENKVHESDRGEMMRSKSEKDIANEINKYKDYLDYKYERPLIVKINGYETVFHPDITVINKKTGKIWYWEHAGKMADPGYANDFVYKMNVYMENGIFQGDNLIVTYETSSIPLNIRNMKVIVKRLCEDGI